MSGLAGSAILGDGLLAGAADRIRDPGGLAFCRDCPGIDCRGGGECASQEIRLGIMPIFEAGSPTRVCFARYQELLESIGPPKCVGFFEYLEDCPGIQFQRTVAVRMKLRNKEGEVPTCFGYR